MGLNFSKFLVELGNSLLEELVFIGFGVELCFQEMNTLSLELVFIVFGVELCFQLLNALSLELILLFKLNDVRSELINLLIEFANFLGSSVRDVAHGGD